MGGDRELDELNNIASAYIAVKRRGIWLRIIVAVLPFLLGIVLLAVVLLLTLSSMSEEENKISYWSDQISEYGLAEIPNEYLELYYRAGAEYNVPWNLLAAIHK